jgi:anti-sigma factor RsiW
MTCREASNLLPRFFDGELDAHQMRAVALHSTRCGTCEAELRELERVQELVSRSVTAPVDEIDLSGLWSAVECRLTTVHVSWWTRVADWWSDGEGQWAVRVPVFAAAAAIAVLALWFLVRVQPTTQPEAPQVATVDNAATLDSLDTGVDSVTMLNDPETRTMVLWVDEEAQSTVPAEDVP